MSVIPRTVTNGFRLEHVRAAAIEAGISAPYVTLALDELLRRGANTPVVFAAPDAPRVSARPTGPLPVAGVRARHAPPSPFAGAPTSLVYEAEVPGQLSPNDFDVIAHTIRSVIGEAGVATALGRSFSWSPGSGENQRRLYISITAVRGRTQIRAEERLGRVAGGIFGGIVGGMGGGLGGGSLGVTLGAMHMGGAAAFVSLGIVAGAYALARTIFTYVSRTRAREVEGLVERLASQVTELVENSEEPKALR